MAASAYGDFMQLKAGGKTSMKSISKAFCEVVGQRYMLLAEPGCLSKSCSVAFEVM